MLKVENINVYINKKNIIKNASLEVGTGRIVGLIGPNGAGKTTIMKTILGLTKFNGNILVDEKKITENNHAGLSQVGALIEHPAIYPFLTGIQNLRLYSNDFKDMNEIVSLLKMGKYINNKSKSYSLGMKQKLGIAIALLNNPSFVILDEPMNGLDIESTILIRKIIKKFASNGTSFLISSHILSELEKVITDIVLINEGKILMKDSMKNFSKVQNPKYKLVTNNMDKTEFIFKKIDKKVKKNDEYFILNKSDLYEVQDLLREKGIYILTLSPEKVNFEQKIIKSLSQKEGD